MKKWIPLLLLLPNLAWGATYYMRVDGTAANMAVATGPCGTVGNTASIATHNAGTFAGDDIINLCDDGGNYTAILIPPSSGTNGHSITYQAATGDIPVIDGGDSIDHAISIIGKNYVTIDGITCRESTSHIVEIAGSVTGCIIKNCTIYDNVADAGIIFWLTGGGANTVDACIIHDTAGDGITWFDTFSGSGTESYLKTSTIYNAGRFGAYLKANYLIVEGNTVYNCGTVGNPYWGIGIQCEASDSGTGQYCIVRYNKVYGTVGDTVDADGIVLDHWTIGNQVYYNLVYGNDGCGITVYNSTNNVVYNNAVYGNLQDATFVQRAEIRCTGALAANNTFKNNIAQATAANTYAILFDSDAYDQTGLELTNNDWYSAATNWYFWNATGGATLATWNALTGVGTDLNSDPLFVSATDFHIVAGSPCKNAGTSVGLTRDKDGIPIVGLPDIGAYEYFGSHGGSGVSIIGGSAQ